MGHEITGQITGIMSHRELTTGAAMDEERFTHALIKALQKEAIQASLQKAIKDEIRKELKEMKDLIVDQRSQKKRE